jgi:hypothetical protein
MSNALSPSTRHLRTRHLRAPLAANSATKPTPARHRLAAMQKTKIVIAAAHGKKRTRTPSLPVRRGPTQKRRTPAKRFAATWTEIAHQKTTAFPPA